MAELVKFTLINCGVSNYLTSRYSEHKEAAAKLEARVRLRPIYTSAGRAHP